ECGQECKREIAELISGQQEETGGQQRATVEPQQPAETQLQSQPVPSLELEALRLSLSHMHTAQLELTQANLQKEKETALTELREMLNGRHAQELALLQSRQQLELQLVREQHARELEEVALRCSQETAELKEKLQIEVEKNVQMMETLKQDWESERDLCLENLCKELSGKHQLELENLQNQFKKELAEQKAELEKMFQAKNEAESSLKTLEAQHEAALRRLHEDLRSERCQYLEDLELKFKEKEKEKQLELETLQASYEELKAQSQEDIRRLWSQLESVRTNTREPGELNEQPLARASHLKELEHLKRAFEEQQQRERTEHESELEQLRIYFEKKLRNAEKNYQEDLTLLQQRLQEVKEDSLLESAEISSSSAFLEEPSEKDRRDQLDQLGLQLEKHEESLCLHTPLEEDHRGRVTAVKSSPEVQQEAELTGARVLEREQHAGLSEESGQGVCPVVLPTLAGVWPAATFERARVCLRYAQDTALEVETEVAARVLSLETEHKVKLSLLQTELKEEIDLLKIENRNLQEKLQYETRLKEDLEKVKHDLVEDHQEELKKAKEKIQLMQQEFKEREAEWKVTNEDLKRKAEEKLTLMLLDLREQAESEKQSLINKFELREITMRQLQDQQAAQILGLEGSLMEQQGRLRQLELELAGDESLQCSQCGREPGGGLAPTDQDRELATLRLKEDCAFQLMLAQNRFLEERKEITEKFTAEQDAVLQEAQEKHASELQLLQERHQQHVLSLTTELQTKHQAEIDELKASFESERWALSEARVAELQTKHAAEISALEMRHLSNLDSLESCYLSEIQAIRDEHRRALELLRVDLEGQLQKKDSSHQMILAQELEKLKLKHAEELQSAKDSLRIEMSTQHVESRKALVAELQGAQQSALLPAELEAQCPALLAQLEEDKQQQLPSQAETELRTCPSEASFEQKTAQLKGEFESEKKAALHEKEEIHRLECEQAQRFYQKEKESLSLQLQEKSNQILQLRDQILTLSREIEEHRSALAQLQQRRERENQEGTRLISMLKSDIDLAHTERSAAPRLGEQVGAASRRSWCALARGLCSTLQVTTVQHLLQVKSSNRKICSRCQSRPPAVLLLSRSDRAGSGPTAAVWCASLLRRALRDALRRLLGLFGETLKAAISLRSRIGERVGLCLEDESPPDMQLVGQAPSAAPALDETWPGCDAALPELDGTLPECAEMSSVAEISSHVCESFFMSPESTLECEQPIRRIYRSLGLAVDGLLEMALNSSRQLEEARQIHSRFEKEFSCKNEETLQVVRKHQELLERLEEENAAKTRLMLELHKAEGVIEGFKVEKASLQEALGRKEASEQGLVVELESLKQQLQRVTQQQAELKEENSTLWSQKEALAAGAEEREAGKKCQFQEGRRSCRGRECGQQPQAVLEVQRIPVTLAHKDSALRREVEYLAKEQSETRKQSEKDRSALLSQMKVLEAELEEQLSRHQACSGQAAELSALRQQMESLDKHLRSQRQFMDWPQ
ncbi:hypothetical protein HPG69_009145, partial [Diceros bicornis minor]